LDPVAGAERRHQLGEAVRIDVIELHDLAEGAVALHRFLVRQLTLRRDGSAGALDRREGAAPGERVEGPAPVDGGKERPHRARRLGALAADARYQVAAAADRAPPAPPAPGPRVAEPRP